MASVTLSEHKLNAISLTPNVVFILCKIKGKLLKLVPCVSSINWFYLSLIYSNI